MALDTQTDEMMDNIDAAFFSGDRFHDAEAVEQAEFYVGRWQRELERIKVMLTQREKDKS